MKTFLLLPLLIAVVALTWVAFGLENPDNDDCEQPCLSRVKITRPSLRKILALKEHEKCLSNKYRTINGSCNNLKQPDWAVVNSKYTRLLPPKYADGLYEPRKSVSNNSLPLARLISTTIYTDVPIPDPKWTLATMSWGQFIAHDMSLALGANQITGENPTCCGNDDKPVARICFPIFIPQDDYFYSEYNTTCLNFIRTATDLDTKENPGDKPAEQLLGTTPLMDASQIYGSTDSVAASLREFNGGRLKVDIRDNRPLPPEVTKNKNGTCFIDKPDEVCYLFGDNRGVQNPGITVLQILFLREHNRIAKELSKINPHWDDEILYQETRKIVIAIYQYINYYEWMPIVLGKKTMLKNKLIYDTKDYVDDYDERVNPGVINSHATGAYRFFHSAIQGFLQLMKENRITSGTKRLSDYYNKPSMLEEGDNLDLLIRGLVTQSQERLDEFHTVEQTNLLFKNKKPFGNDLKATDIQRSRDHGLPPYNDFRELCGFQKARSFDDFQDHIHIGKITHLAELYESPDDVDYTVGGSLESNLPGALVGPTFVCVLLEQFYRSRVGDRYFFESGQHNHSFTLHQLNEIRKASMARVTCDNGDNVHNVQPKAFEKISVMNKMMSCENHKLIPTIDLTKWKEY